MTDVMTNVMERIDKVERYKRLAFVVGAALEAFFLAGFLLLADLHNRTHVLLLMSTVAGYTLVILGLVAVAAQIERSSLRMLKAIETVAK